MFIQTKIGQDKCYRYLIKHGLVSHIAVYNHYITILTLDIAAYVYFVWSKRSFSGPPKNPNRSSPHKSSKRIKKYYIYKLPC